MNAILSRFYNPNHLIHIESDPTIKIEDIITKQKDLYGKEEFFNNYIRTNPCPQWPSRAKKPP